MEKSMGFRSGLDGGHSPLSIKSGIFSESQVCVTRAVWAGAPSCWNRNRFLLNIVAPRSFTTGSKIRSLYVAELIFTPGGTNINGVRPKPDTPAQTITESGFWTLLTKRSSSGIAEKVGDKILSF